MSLNRWQTVWRSVDEARMIVRIMVFAKLALLASYIFIVTSGLFELADKALDKDMDLAQVAVLIGAVTAFATFTIPILVSMYRDIWKDYRQSGVDWDVVAERQKLAETGEVRPTFVAQSMKEQPPIEKE